jgi:hypothetical protein
MRCIPHTPEARQVSSPVPRLQAPSGARSFRIKPTDNQKRAGARLVQRVRGIWGGAVEARVSRKSATPDGDGISSSLEVPGMYVTSMSISLSEGGVAVLELVGFASLVRIGGRRGGTAAAVAAAAAATTASAAVTAVVTAAAAAATAVEGAWGRGAASLARVAPAGAVELKKMTLFMPRTVRTIVALCGQGLLGASQCHVGSK